MRPDEDYAEMDENQPVGSSRAMSWMVLAVAVGGFAALAYYAYNSGSKPANGGETMTVEADQSPIKEAPVNAEGEQFPDKDKTIYDVIAPNGEAKTGEKLMPDAEHPVAATNTEDSEDDAAPSAMNAENSAAPTPASDTTNTFVAGTPTAPATQPAQTVSEQPVATTARPVPTTVPVTVVKAEPKSYSSPEMVNEKTLTGKKEMPVEAAKTESKTKPKVEPKKPSAVKPAAGGSYKVQLGAFKSEEEAQASWKKISAAHSGVLGGSPTIVKADVNGTTYYRLRTGSFADAAAAKATCAQLGSQACMPVK